MIDLGKTGVWDSIWIVLHGIVKADVVIKAQFQTFKDHEHEMLLIIDRTLSFSVRLKHSSFPIIANELSGPDVSTL